MTSSLFLSIVWALILAGSENPEQHPTERWGAYDETHSIDQSVTSGIQILYLFDVFKYAKRKANVSGRELLDFECYGISMTTIFNGDMEIVERHFSFLGVQRLDSEFEDADDHDIVSWKCATDDRIRSFGVSCDHDCNYMEMDAFTDWN
ncbi:hypothetical protein F1654_03430 [Alkalicaulis satelles]|uniref:Uncharacterized protein n=1 Tax=Alkalicaulis satelles TaxID=2609175 RepID=A0A5M6ZP99_9PROT|nr:hypothetical protein [Alkalicaulis satelles]KAA5805058.1 hypothetical protein F1654_03430 [Alkalicaulis satelles]